MQIATVSGAIQVPDLKARAGAAQNSGFVDRQLIDSDTVMIGANIFFDHTFKEGHNRISIGVDADTAYYGISANRYIPISDWRSAGAIYEERPMPGWDCASRGVCHNCPHGTVIWAALPGNRLAVRMTIFMA